MLRLISICMILILKTDLTSLKKIGLSSLEYDYKRNHLYIMTSYENGVRSVGAYLWVTTLDKQSDRLRKPRSVVDGNLNYFHFAHKGEALAITRNGNILIVADDDKVLGRDAKDIVDKRKQFSREFYQGAYMLLRITPGS